VGRANKTYFRVRIQFFYSIRNGKRRIDVSTGATAGYDDLHLTVVSILLPVKAVCIV